MARTALYGAILGDIIGSPFEFKSIRHKSKDFELFSEKSKFTDDTVMTIAIADAILKTGCEKDGRILFKNVKSPCVATEKNIRMQVTEELFANGCKVKIRVLTTVSETARR